jgi:hypothetical protein
LWKAQTGWWNTTLCSMSQEARKDFGSSKGEPTEGLLSAVPEAQSA